MKPRIGEPRVYRDEIDILYPGEQAAVSIEFDAETGEQNSIYLVEPAPGLRARWLRLRYRLFGSHGKPKLEMR